MRTTPPIQCSINGAPARPCANLDGDLHGEWAMTTYTGWDEIAPHLGRPVHVTVTALGRAARVGVAIVGSMTLEMDPADTDSPVRVYLIGSTPLYSAP